jgi:TPR repeat protein
MVEKNPRSIGDLENMTEVELESLIISESSDDARQVLGRLQLEGTSDKIAKNPKKGINWIKEAAKNGHMGALEYKVYYEVRFERSPNMVKLLKSLETVIDKTKSARACNMIAEFNQIQDKKDGTAIEAARYYSISSDQGCQIGIHWMGVFYHLGFGVAKNLDKAIELLTRAGKQGNG